MTLYGGTDYSVVSTAAVTSPAYSMVKAPFGFPLSPIKWTVSRVDGIEWAVSTPVTTTWYNTGTVYVSLPIGVWNVSYHVTMNVDDAGVTYMTVDTTLSTANNSESSSYYTFRIGYQDPTSNRKILRNTWQKSFSMTITSRTTYYRNVRIRETNAASVDAIYIENNLVPETIYAVCSYL